MKYRTLLLLVFISSTASADLLCAKNVAKAKKGKVAFANNLQVTTDSTCPAGYSPVFDTEALRGEKGDKGDTGASGPTGPAGSNGMDGLLTISQCRTVLGVDSIVGSADYGTVVADCTSSEFLLTHSGTTTDINTDVVGNDLRYFPDEDFPSGVVYEFGRNNPSNTNTVVIGCVAVCCPR